MKKAVFLLLALTAATPALAQQASDHDDRDHHDGDHHDGDHHDRKAGHNQQRPGGHDADHGPRPDQRSGPNRNPDNRPQARPYLRPNGGPPDAAHRSAAGAPPGGWDHRGDDHADDRRNQSWQTPRPPGWHPDDRRGDRGGYDRGRGDDHRGGWNGGDRRPGGWDRNWRGDARYDWQRYRNDNRERFRGPRYFAPRGYGYRQWYPGIRIQPFFYGRNYWIQDFYDYRLPPPPPGAQWVRYYNDIALINVYNGTVLDVIQGFFY